MNPFTTRTLFLFAILFLCNTYATNASDEWVEPEDIAPPQQTYGSIDPQQLFGQNYGLGGNVNELYGMAEALGEEMEDDLISKHPIFLAQDLWVNDICCGGYATTILEKDTGRIRQYGILGENSPEMEVVFPEDVKIVSIACGDYFTLALSDKGEIWSWGREDSHLGHPLSKSHNDLDKSPGEIGGFFNKPRRILGSNKQPLSPVTSISGGHDHSLAVLQNGRIHAWGNGEKGATGIILGKISRIPELMQIPSLRAKNFKDACASDQHSLLLTEKGELYYVGKDTNSQNANEAIDGPMDKPPQIQRILPDQTVKSIACGGDHFLALTEDKKVYGWGWNEHGQTGTSLTDSKDVENPVEIQELSDKNIESIACGKYAHSLAVSENGDLYGWGWNENGQLGLGNNDSQFTPVKVEGISNVKKVSAGYKHSAGITKDGKVFGFGDNVYGQLGTEKDE